MKSPKLSLLVGILCISFSPIMVKLAGVAGTTAALYRLLFAWLLLAPYVIYAKKYKVGFKPLVIAITGGLVFGLDIALWNISILISTATVSTVIANLAPVWVGLLAWLILKKPAGWLFWTGTAGAIAGMVILVGLQDIINLRFNLGVMLALTSSFLYAVYILLTKKVLQQIDTFTFMFYNMLAATVFLIVMAVVRGEQVVGLTVNTWVILFITGAVSQLAGWITINYAIKHLDSTQVSLTLLSQTFITGLLAMLILHETIAAREIIGGLLILAGIAVTFMKRKPATRIVD